MSTSSLKHKMLWWTMFMFTIHDCSKIWAHNVEIKKHEIGQKNCVGITLNDHHHHKLLFFYRVPTQVYRDVLLFCSYCTKFTYLKCKLFIRKERKPVLIKQTLELSSGPSGALVGVGLTKAWKWTETWAFFLALGNKVMFCFMQEDAKKLRILYNSVSFHLHSAEWLGGARLSKRTDTLEDGKKHFFSTNGVSVSQTRHWCICPLFHSSIWI